MRSELNGIIVIDKPAGMTSAKVVAKVKKILEAAKVGHTGTLDPFATGVLICCVNQATRLARFFLEGAKRYEGLLRLGISTDTQDATGQVTARTPVPPVGNDRLAEVFSRFEGRQWQQPPVYAALKHQGQPLYKLARQGVPVQKPPRQVTISALRIVDIALPDIRFEVACSAGTYIRTLCSDIGRVLGCGAHLVELRRTASCGFGLAEAVPLDDLQEVCSASHPATRLVPMAKALRHMPTWVAGESVLNQIRHGRPLHPDQFPDDAIHRPAEDDGCPYLKVVDRMQRLCAVLERCAEGPGYNYCCVFN